MTREGLIEVMARAIYETDQQDNDQRWDALPRVSRSSYMRYGRYALSALEAAGVRLVPVEAVHVIEAVAQISDEVTAHADPSCAVIVLGKAELTMRDLRRAASIRDWLAASPYAPQKDESND